MTTTFIQQQASSSEGWIQRHYIDFVKPISDFEIPSAISIIESGENSLRKILKEVLFRASLRTFSSNNTYSFTGYNQDLALPHLIVENLTKTRILGFDNSENGLIDSSEVKVRETSMLPVVQIPLPDDLLGVPELQERMRDGSFPSPAEHLSRTWFINSEKRSAFFRHLADSALINVNSNPTLWNRQQAGRNFLKNINDFI